MIAEVGHFSLALALAFAVLLALLPLYGVRRQHGGYMTLARPLSYGMFFFTLISYIALTYGFLVGDFSIDYVARNSSSVLPWYYRITAVWSSHEGSFLLWMLAQASWGAALAVYTKRLPLSFSARVLSVIGFIGIGFYTFMLFTSNPFDRTLPIIPVDGNDMNPLLQDPGMIIHPPLLYFGYVGMSVAFAFAIAALSGGRLDAAWARWSRPWTLAAWVFLTLGIMVGSWWAYYELGWGGWWFWDPVENASFMPWLIATALIHSLAVTEKRGTFKAWTVLLAITGFSLALLGTFLVRSGVLVSVHAFAADPKRGLFLLAFLGIVIVGSLLLFAFRASRVITHAKYELVSREVMLLANNILLLTATMVVLLGTLLPLVHQQLGLGDVSIGEPFFNGVFFWLVIPFAFVIGMAPLMRWRRQDLQELIQPMLLALGLALALGYFLPWILTDRVTAVAVLGVVIGLWVFITTVQELRLRVAKREHKLPALVKLGKSHWAMVLGHIGFAFVVIGIALVQSYEVERTVRMAPGDTYIEGPYSFTFKELKHREGSNWVSDAAVFELKKHDKYLDTVITEKRLYTIQRQVQTKTAIHATPFRDLYLAMGESLGDGSWAIRVQVKPFIRWMWFGGILMALGGFLAITDKRYRLSRPKTRKPKTRKPKEQGLDLQES